MCGGWVATTPFTTACLPLAVETQAIQDRRRERARRQELRGKATSSGGATRNQRQPAPKPSSAARRQQPVRRAEPGNARGDPGPPAVPRSAVVEDVAGEPEEFKVRRAEIARLRREIDAYKNRVESGELVAEPRASSGSLFEVRACASVLAGTHPAAPHTTRAVPRPYQATVRGDPCTRPRRHSCGRAGASRRCPAAPVEVTSPISPSRRPQSPPCRCWRRRDGNSGRRAHSRQRQAGWAGSHGSGETATQVRDSVRWQQRQRRSVVADHGKLPQAGGRRARSGKGSCPASHVVALARIVLQGVAWGGARAAATAPACRGACCRARAATCDLRPALCRLSHQLRVMGCWGGVRTCSG